MKNNHSQLNKILLIHLVCLLILIITTPINAQANKENSFCPAGTYKVNIITPQQYNYSTKIGIEDLGNGRIKVSGRIDGISLSATGDQTGKATATSSVYGCKISVPKLFNGSMDMTIQCLNHNYKLSALVKGTYYYQGSSGNCSARITGRRISSSLPAYGAKASFNTLLRSRLLLYGSGFMVILAMICLWINHRMNSPNPDNR